MAEGRVNDEERDKFPDFRSAIGRTKCGRRLRLMTRRGAPSVPCCVIVEWVSATVRAEKTHLYK